MSRTSASGTAALVARHLRSRASTSLALALLVAVSVGLAALLPRATVLLSDAELHHQVSELAPGVSDLYGTGDLGPLDTTGAPTSDQLFGQTDTVLSGLPRSLPAPLSGALGAVSWVALLPPDQVTLDAPRLLVQPVLNLAVDLHWRDRVTLVQGAAPSAWNGRAAARLEMAISEDYAQLAGLALGDELLYLEATVVVTGIYSVNDRGAPYWTHVPELSAPTVTTVPGSPTRVRGGAFIDPASAAALPTSLQRSELRAWYPVLTDTMTYAEVPEMNDQLRRMSSLGLYLPTGESLVFGTGLPAAFDRVSATLATVAALLAIVGSAPVGALLAVLALGARTVAHQRRPVLVLAASRGASPLQLRLTMLLEGVLIGVPAAVIVLVLVAALAPVRVPPDSYVLPVVIALAVPLLFVTTMAPVTRDHRRGRWIVETIVVGIAGLAVFLLGRRGLVVTGGGVDPLLAATPLLVTLVVCIIVLRLFPLPLLALQEAAKNGSSPVSLVGAAGAIRPTGVVYPSVFAMVVAVSATVFSLVVVSTVVTGLATAAVSRTGSDIRVSAQALDNSDEVRAVVGVRAVAVLYTAYGVRIALGADSPGVTVVFADVTALHDVRPDIPALRRGEVLVSRDIARRDQRTSTLNGHPVTIVGTVPAAGLPGATRSWVIADLADAPAVMADDVRVDTFLIATEPAADIAATAAAIEAVVTEAQLPRNRGRVTVIDTATLTSDAAARPSVAGTIFGLIAAAALSLLLCVLAVALEALGAADRRSRTRGILRLLGMSPAQLRGVLVWDVAPVAITALVAGTGFGVALGCIVTGLVDLGSLTGGPAEIAATVPWALVGGSVVVFALLVTATAALTSAGARRLDAAAAVKMGAE